MGGGNRGKRERERRRKRGVNTRLGERERRKGKWSGNHERGKYDLCVTSRAYKPLASILQWLSDRPAKPTRQSRGHPLVSFISRVGRRRSTPKPLCWSVWVIGLRYYPLHVVRTWCITSTGLLLLEGIMSVIGLFCLILITSVDITKTWSIMDVNIEETETFLG